MGDSGWERERGPHPLPPPALSGRTQPLLLSGGLLHWGQAPLLPSGFVPEEGKVGRKGANIMGRLLSAF